MFRGGRSALLMLWLFSLNSGQLVGRGLTAVAAALPGDWGSAGSRGGASGLLLWLVLLPLVGAVLPGWLERRAARRAVVGLLLGTAAVAAYLLILLSQRAGLDRGAGELVQPLWRVLAVNRLQLAVGLVLDRPAAALLGIAALGAAWAVRTAERGQIAWLAATCTATAVALLGDSLVTRLVGWELLTVTGWALSQRRAGAALLVARVGDATLLIAVALLFWALGGSWSSSRLDSRYQLDFSPPHGAVVAASPEAVVQGPTLDLPSLHAQLHRLGPAEASILAVRATLYNKLWLGGRLLTWLGVLFGLAAALKALAGVLQLLAARGSPVAVRLWLGGVPGLCAGHLLWRLW